MNFQGAPNERLTIPLARAAWGEADFASSQPLLGYRAWLIERTCDGYELCSVVTPAQWAGTPGGWTEAVCNAKAESGFAVVRHDQTIVPHLDCTCGLYAYHSLSIGGYDERVLQQDSVEIGLVWGAVVGAGRVLVYQDGWRAQFARPVAILQGSGAERHVRGAADRLAIPSSPSSDIERLAAYFGRLWSAVAIPA
jgi:hypothetical protein